ncbi:hypothetical protein C3L33_17191, partial [Rhododendron williamsianum]
MHSSNPPDNYQNYSAYSNPPPSVPQPYAPPQHYAQQPYQPPPPPSAPPPYDGHPVTGIPVSARSSPGPWSTGLCDCFEDVSNCEVVLHVGVRALLSDRLRRLLTKEQHMIFDLTVKKLISYNQKKSSENLRESL